MKVVSHVSVTIEAEQLIQVGFLQRILTVTCKDKYVNMETDQNPLEN